MDKKVLSISIARFIRVSGRSAIFIFLPIIFVLHYGMSLFETGAITATATAVMATVQYFSGPLSDIYGRKFFMEVIPFITAVPYVFLFWTVGYSNNVIYMILAWMSTMFLASLQFPALQAAVADLTSSGQRLAGYTQVRVFANIGAAVGPMVGAFTGIYGFQWIFLIAGGTSIIEGIMLHYAVGETMEKKVREKVNPKKSSPFWKSEFIIIFTLSSLLFNFVTRQTGAAFTLYIFNIRSVNLIQLGFVYSLNGLLVVLLQIPVYRMMNRSGNIMQWRAIGTAIYGISFSLLALYSGILFFIFVMGLITIGEDFSSPTTQTILMDVAPESMRGNYTGKFAFLTSFGSVAGSFAGLWLLQAFYTHADIFWIIIGTAGIIASIWTLLMVDSYMKEKRNLSALEKVVID